MLPLVTGLASIALYAGATAALVLGLRRAPGRRNRQAIVLAWVAALVHAWLLHGHVYTPAGLDLGFFHALALAAWVSVVLMLLLSLSQPVENLGLALFPVSAVVVASLLAWGGGGPTIITESAGLDAHIFISLCAWGVLSLAAVQALVLAVQHRLLHEHHPLTAVRSLPPLYVMETLLFRMIAIGFVLLTAALLTGFVFLEDMFAQRMVHKTVLSIVAWLMFAILLTGHWLAGWRGLLAVRLTLAAIAVLLLAYFGSKFVIEIILQRTG